jgi:hypothetical protein
MMCYATWCRDDPAAVYNFISNLENFVNLSQQIRCAIPKSRGNKPRRKTTQVQFLEVTYVRKSLYFWEVLETADSTFQAQDAEIAMVLSFISRNTLGEKTTSTFTLGKLYFTIYTAILSATCLQYNMY